MDYNILHILNTLERVQETKKVYDDMQRYGDPGFYDTKDLEEACDIFRDSLGAFVENLVDKRITERALISAVRVDYD